MRPRGEIRAALAAAAERLVPMGTPDGQGATWRELVRHACVGELMGRRTVENMARDGELLKVGVRVVPGICRPVNVYAPAREVRPDGAAALTAVVLAWRG